MNIGPVVYEAGMLTIIATVLRELSVFKLVLIKVNPIFGQQVTEFCQI